MNPCGVAVDQTGLIIVSDWDNHRIQLFTPEGKYFTKFGTKGMFVTSMVHVK